MPYRNDTSAADNPHKVYVAMQLNRRNFTQHRADCRSRSSNRLFGAESFARYMEKGIIEVAPLAYMRGRTLDEAFIILDEAQNTTSEQIKMFLTRLGNESKMVITGDITQIDLPDKKKSGLVEAVKVLRGIDDIFIHKFSEKDVVRHRLVQDIIKAYEKYNNSGEGRMKNYG